MLKDIHPDKQLRAITKLFEQFEFAYDPQKYRIWQEDNAALTWVQFLADATSESIMKAMKQALEVDFIYELPSVTEFAKLCGIEPITATEPFAEHVDTETGEITAPEPAKQEYEREPKGIGWAVNLWRRQKTGEVLPIDSINMMRRALKMGD